MPYYITFSNHVLETSWKHIKAQYIAPFVLARTILRSDTQFCTAFSTVSSFIRLLSSLYISQESCRPTKLSMRRTMLLRPLSTRRTSVLRKRDRLNSLLEIWAKLPKTRPTTLAGLHLTRPTKLVTQPATQPRLPRKRLLKLRSTRPAFWSRLELR